MIRPVSHGTRDVCDVCRERRITYCVVGYPTTPEPDGDLTPRPRLCWDCIQSGNLWPDEKTANDN